MRKIKPIYVVFCVLLILTWIYLSLSHVEKVRLGGGYTYYPESNFILGDDHKIDIPPMIYKISYNDKYIVVQQCPEDNYPNAIFDNNFQFNYPVGLDSTYYWIIDKCSDRLLDGPILKDRYLSIIDAIDTIQMKVLQKGK